MSFLLALIGISSLARLLWKINSPPSSKENYPLPPSPPTNFLLGHLLHIPPHHPEDRFAEWKEQYGPVISLRIPILNRTLIVLNTLQSATDLLEKRGGNYSERPEFPVFTLMGWNRTLTFLSYSSEYFQKHRKLLHSYLSRSKCTDYQDIQRSESYNLLNALKVAPEDFAEHVIRYSTAVIIRIAYGHQIPAFSETSPEEDLYLKMAEAVGNAQSNSGAPGGTLLDFLPFVQHLPSWMPGTYYASYARKNKENIRKLHDYPFEEVKKQMAVGTAAPSYLSYHLSNIPKEELQTESDIEDIKSTAGVMYCAGTDTTYSVLLNFIFAMVIHPEAQLKAQQELDAVVGKGNLPIFDDRERLPYVECLLQECLRWITVTPTGVPHHSLEDDVYNGMFIPKGSLVIANIKAMSLDPNIYSSPECFNPSRYLPKPEGNAEPFPTAHFGFGRRICPGRFLAEGTLWIAVASILSCFNISKAIGPDGKEVTPNLELTSGISSHVKPYQCLIQPRKLSLRG